MVSVWVLFNDGQDKEVKEEEDQRPLKDVNKREREIEKKGFALCLSFCCPGLLAVLLLLLDTNLANQRMMMEREKYSSKQERKKKKETRKGKCVSRMCAR